MGLGQYTWTIDFIEKIKRGLLFPPMDRESGIVNPVYIDNLIDALLLMRTHPSIPGQIFNVVDGNPLRASDYIRRLAQMVGKRTFALPAFVLKAGSAFLIWRSILRGRESTTTPGSTNFLFHKVTINGEKIREVLGWTPSIDQEEAFHCIEQWLRREGYLG